MFWVMDSLENMVIAMYSLLKEKENYMHTDMQNCTFDFTGSRIIENYQQTAG